MPLPYPEALPVCVPLGEQVPQPPDLPKDWAELSLEQRATYLTDNSPLLRVTTYVSAGLELGAKRADQAAGGGSIMQDSLASALNTPEVHARLKLGNEEHVKLPSSYRRLCTPIHDFFGPELNNPNLIKTWGMDLRELRAPFNAADSAEWPLALQATMRAQFLHQAAAKIARASVKPLIGEEPKRIQEGMERQFWKSRLVGVAGNLGVAYGLGYRAKSGPIVKNTMQQQWGEDYTFNREVFIAAINMDINSAPKKERDLFQNEVRRPVFSLIGQGHFNLACGALQKAAAEKPQAFSLLSQRFLRKQQQS